MNSDSAASSFAHVHLTLQAAQYLHASHRQRVVRQPWAPVSIMASVRCSTEHVEDRCTLGPGLDLKSIEPVAMQSQSEYSCQSYHSDTGKSLQADATDSLSAWTSPIRRHSLQQGTYMASYTTALSFATVLVSQCGRRSNVSKRFHRFASPSARR